MAENEHKLEVALPGEWVLKKTLGPVLAEIGDDLKNLYAKGRDKIINKAYKKLDDPNDGKRANLRLAYATLSNGAFTDDEICAEYFGGILASSRSADGKNDDAMQLLDTIKSLSSKQLHLHYILYRSFNRLLLKHKEQMNVGQGSEVGKKTIWFVAQELQQLGINYDTDLNILHREGLVSAYKIDMHKIDESHILPYANATPTTYGVLLYAVAHNKLAGWREFSTKQFPEFEGIELPKLYEFDITELLAAAGVALPKS